MNGFVALADDPMDGSSAATSKSPRDGGKRPRTAHEIAVASASESQRRR